MLCDALASSLSIFLENLLLYEDVQAMFMGTLHALTSAIDAKDSYTRGHSERVALMSKMLAQAVGLNDEESERVYLSGLVHDLGKIGVPEAVLTKPGKLTAEEYDLIKQHPTVGARIIQGIRQMEDLVPGILSHHERWDGAGYPKGLAGEQIPLFGRLIAVVDAFDAMSSKRAYRESLDHDAALDEIRDHAGRQFDPDMVDAFLQLDFSDFYQMIQQHKTPGEPPSNV